MSHRGGLWWHQWMLGLAEKISTASKDPSTQVGALIIDQDRCPVSWGYNGFGRKVEDTEERYNNRELKYKLTIHAEMNAIINCKDMSRLVGSSIYVYPTIMVPNVCPECAKHVAQVGIKHVYYWDAVNDNPRWADLAVYSTIIFNEVGVECIGISR